MSTQIAGGDGQYLIKVNSDGSIPVDISSIGTVNIQGGNSTAVKVDGGSGNPIPISAVSLPLASNAATDGHLTNVQSAAGTPNATVLNVQGNAGGVALPVSGTVAVTGVATDAHLTNVQSAAGSANATALTIQGNSGGIAVPVSMSGAGSGSSVSTPTYVAAVMNGAVLSSTNTLPVNLSRGYTAAYMAAASWTNSTTAVGAVLWAMMNNGSTKTAYIRKIRMVCFAGTAPGTSLKAINLCFISTATPTGGTAVVPSNKNTGSVASTVVGYWSYAAAGLTMTGVTKGTLVDSFTYVGDTSARSETLIDYGTDDELDRIALTPGYGLALYAQTALMATDIFGITVEWSER